MPQSKSVNITKIVFKNYYKNTLKQWKNDK